MGSDLSDYIGDKFSDVVTSRPQIFFSDTSPMFTVCDLNAEKYMESDEFQFYPTTYEESLAKIVGSSGFTVIKQFAAVNDCAVIYGAVTGYTHTPDYSIYLVWQDGSIKQLPLPAINAWYTAAEPENIYLSEDKSKLYYKVTFDGRMVIDEGLLSEEIIHEEGTYGYTVDIATGDVDLVIIK